MDRPQAWPFRAVAAVLLLSLAACAKPPAETVRPALWQVEDARGGTAWLLGTIHALPAPVAWRSPAIDRAIAASDSLLLEITDDGARVATIFAGLARSPDLPPVAERVPPRDRPRLSALLEDFGLSEPDLRATETWAVAMILSQKAQGQATARYGIEAEVRAAAKGKPVAALEGAAAQLAVFDRLPEADQRELLTAVIDEAAQPDGPDVLGTAWKLGDMVAIERETRTGMMADPELREALLLRRNRAWAHTIAARLVARGHPLVAVGAAHMAGPDGLPALLAAKGFRVVRVQ